MVGLWSGDLRGGGGLRVVQTIGGVRAQGGGVGESRMVGWQFLPILDFNEQSSTKMVLKVF